MDILEAKSTEVEIASRIIVIVRTDVFTAHNCGAINELDKSFERGEKSVCDAINPPYFFVIVRVSDDDCAFVDNISYPYVFVMQMTT